MLVLAPLPESQFFYAGSSRLFGLEAGWTGRVGENFTYGLAYTFLDVQDDLDTESEDAPAELADFFTGQVLANTNIFYERGTPAHTINLRAGYVWRKLTLDRAAVWTSSYEVPLLGDTPGSRGQFVLIDIPSRWHVLATAAYAVTDALEARFTAEGPTDRRFPEAPIYEAERRIIGTLTYRF